MSETRTPTTVETLPGETPRDRGSIEFDPGETASVSVRKSLEQDERTKLAGLTVENEDIRYQVIDEAVQRKVTRTVITKRVGILPKITTIKEGHRARLRWAHTETSVKKVGLPRFSNEGKYKTISRREAPLPNIETDIPVVTVAAYSVKSGDPVSIFEVPREKFYEALDGMSTVTKDGAPSIRGTWEKQPTGPHKPRVSIKLPDHTPDKNGGTPKIFDDLTEQLETLGITSWRSLRWTRGNITQEIVWDKAIRTHGGTDNVPYFERTFGLKTTLNGKTLPLQVLSNYQLLSTLEATKPKDTDKPGQARPITNITIDQELAQRDSVEETARDSERQEKIKKYLAEVALKDSSAELKRDAIAEWLLRNPELLTTEEKDIRIKQILASPVGRKRVDALFALAAKHGLDKLSRTIDELQQQFDASIKKLNILGSLTVGSVGQIAELIAAHQDADPLGHTPEARSSRIEIVDEMVGRAATNKESKDDSTTPASPRTFIRLSVNNVPSDKLNEFGQSMLEPKADLKFNEDILNRSDNPVTLSSHVTLWRRKEYFRKPVRDAARDIYDLLKENKPVPREAYIDLGRKFRRMVGE